MRRWWGLVASALMSGCLLTGTKVFSVELDDLVLDGAEIAATDVDLLRNTTFEEHRNDIEKIDRVGIEGELVNRADNDVSLSLWIHEDASLTDVAEITTSGRRILSELPVAAGERRDIEYGDVLRDLENRDDLDDAVSSGSFGLYAVSDSGETLDITLFDLVLIVTFTVSL